jgi:hypothetical protein
MIRKIHLLLGMFLTPWVIMYAASTIAMLAGFFEFRRIYDLALRDL